MADSIESFVSKLQDEGVEAGRKEAQKIKDVARAEADRIVQEAQQKAQKTLDDAEQQAKDTRERGQTDLRLAARDTVLRLRETLSRVLRTVLLTRTGQALGDIDFLKGLIRDVVMQYAQAEREGKAAVDIRVSDEVRDRLTDWCRQELQPKAEAGGVAIDLQGALAEAGFEYQVEGANVEVTRASVVETLSDLVSPRLREMVERAAEESQPAQDSDQPNQS
ncbi:MAG: hypothetical protein ISS74_05270 [Planctomycetes bacterium]|nr:hypothetical protein [Planctomycetota bacterium]